MRKVMKVGVFDSGIGGMTVLRELVQRFPSEEYVYFGDTANVPYGTKSAAQVEKFSREGARLLRAKGIETLVVACNTASSLALEAIREEMGEIPVLGVVEPGVRSVMAAYQEKPAPVLVLATRATVASGAYGRALRTQGVGSVIEQACPLLVPFIEEGWVDHPILHQVVEEYLRPHRKSGTPPAGIALLACTHYPWIEAAFQKALPGWRVINSAKAVAQELERQLQPQPRSQSRESQTGQRAPVEWVFSDPAALPAFARQWMDSVWH